jgi:uncharacterized coiled-coil protein SlyX
MDHSEIAEYDTSDGSSSGTGSTGRNTGISGQGNMTGVIAGTSISSTSMGPVGKVVVKSGSSEILMTVALESMKLNAKLSDNFKSMLESIDERTTSLEKSHELHESIINGLAIQVGELKAMTESNGRLIEQLCERVNSFHIAYRMAANVLDESARASGFFP